MIRAVSKAIAATVIVLILVAFCYSAVFATEPYSGTTNGDLKVGLPGDKTVPSSGVSSGTKLVLSGSGFKPNSKYNILWDGKVVVDPYADANGNAYYEYTIPAGSSAGTHTLSAQGVTPSDTTLVLAMDVKVRKRTSGGSSSYPFTGGGLLQYLLIAGIVFIVVGFGAKLVRRTR